MPTASRVIGRTYRPYKWTDGTSRTFPQPFIGNPNVWLPSTHWVAAKVPFSTNVLGDQGNQEICRIYPRPDSETNTWARHRWFYYDGTNVLPQVIPLGARGGAFPFIWVVLQSPANATVTIGSTYRGGLPSSNYDGYADLTVTPTGSFTNETFWIRAYGQDGDWLDFIWTASTVGGYYFNATTRTDSYGFIFLDPVNGTDPTSYPSTTGLVSTIASPIKTFTGAFGSTSGTQTYPNAYIIARAGTIPVYQGSVGNAVAFYTGRSPNGIIAYPGESVVLDVTDGNGDFGFGFSGLSDYDTFLQGFSHTGIPTGAAAANTTYRYFWQGSPSYRFTIHNVSFPNAFSGYHQANNAMSIYWSGSFTTGLSQYLFLKGVTETNRGNIPGNPSNGENYCIAGMYSTSRGLAEFCSVTGASATICVYLKASNEDWTLRCNSFEMEVAPATGGFVMASGDQTNSNSLSGRLEYCYNLAVMNDSPAYRFVNRANLAAFNLADHEEWWYRNSFVGGASSNYAFTLNGPYEYENCAIEWGSANAAAMYYWISGMVDTLPLPANLINEGTECQAQSGVFDPTTYLLTGTYRTDYLGQRGCEIG